MTDDRPAHTERSLDEIFDRAIDLAAGRLGVMETLAEATEFDRGARSVGALIRAAMQVVVLKAQTEKEAASDAAQPSTKPLSDDDLAKLKTDIEAQIDRIDGRESQEADD